MCSENLYERQVRSCTLFKSVLTLNLNETQEHIVNWNALLDVELYNDNFKMFNQAWEETLSAPGDLDEGVLEKLYERQVRKSTPMKNALTLVQSDTVPKREPRKSRK